LSRFSLAGASPASILSRVGLSDRLLDASVAWSFDRTGYRRHRKTFNPADTNVDLSGKTAIVTGANSGLGYEIALGLGTRGARVIVACRNPERGADACRRLQADGASDVRLEQVDVSQLASVREFCERFEPAAVDAGAGRARESVDILVHNAGVLPQQRSETADGHEQTWATHVLGPHLMTAMLRPTLDASAARVIWMSSGGMYTRKLSLADPNWKKRAYDGVLAYAETKRAQVVLSELWADYFAKRQSSVTVNAMHPD
jgi:dehydrogenase/reductase SDR family protein 12